MFEISSSEEDDGSQFDVGGSDLASKYSRMDGTSQGGGGSQDDQYGSEKERCARLVRWLVDVGFWGLGIEVLMRTSGKSSTNVDGGKTRTSETELGKSAVINTHF